MKMTPEQKVKLMFPKARIISERHIYGKGYSVRVSPLGGWLVSGARTPKQAWNLSWQWIKEVVDYRLLFV
jgi:hypothetical protein